MVQSSDNNLLKQESLVDKLSSLATNYGYQMMQINGQRIFTPITSGPSPDRGTEIFIGNIPREVNENELFPLFLNIGAIHEMRVMVDFSGLCKGFAFVSYYNSQFANEAIEKLHQYKIRPNKRLIVALSLDNRRLFVGNIPKEKTLDEMYAALNNYMDGIVNIIMHKDVLDENFNRGYIFVEFESHRKAYMARRKLYPGVLALWGQELSVDWADPVPIVSPSILATVQVLYLKNIPVEFNNNQLRNILLDILELKQITKVYKNDNYAFVHFNSRQAAEIGMKILTGFIMKNKTLIVEWARPPQFSKENRMSQVPDHHCSSMPPKMRQMMSQKFKHRTRPSSSKSSSVSSSPSSSSHASSRNSTPEYQLWGDSFIGENFGVIRKKPIYGPNSCNNNNNRADSYSGPLSHSANLFNVPTQATIFSYYGNSMIN